ncbi:putative calcium-binding protein [Hoeflea sp. IMCC20628]|uniref:calcium-binding protein n=1 Tax=Hoeflea sp. IMCC20628 TaxID=1620421 RepID=UPI00063BE4B8|nr:calcium-binding protein [Hoeflea sp. IMCC20628]AKI00716.1 putative calcium-binding protein [Hoeflea sp. IMCC20628]
MSTVSISKISSVIGPRNSLALLGTSRKEVARGGSFSDIFYTRGGVDEFHGGLGSDTISFSGYGEGLTIRGSAGYARLGDGTQVTTFTGIENIFATSDDDDITGNSGPNTILGRAGSDTINGGSGDDIIQGGLGRDLLTGGRGNDTIDGGTDPNDYAFFSGNQSDFNITTVGDVTTVEWIGAGSGDGTDTLTNIEFLGFDDGFYYL